MKIYCLQREDTYVINRIYAYIFEEIERVVVQPWLKIDEINFHFISPPEIKIGSDLDVVKKDYKDIIKTEEVNAGIIVLQKSTHMLNTGNGVRCSADGTHPQKISISENILSLFQGKIKQKKTIELNLLPVMAANKYWYGLKGCI